MGVFSYLKNLIKKDEAYKMEMAAAQVDAANNDDEDDDDVMDLIRKMESRCKTLTTEKIEEIDYYIENYKNYLRTKGLLNDRMVMLFMEANEKKLKLDGVYSFYFLEEDERLIVKWYGILNPEMEEKEEEKPCASHEVDRRKADPLEEAEAILEDEEWERD